MAAWIRLFLTFSLGGSESSASRSGRPTYGTLSTEDEVNPINRLDFSEGRGQ